MLACAAWLLRHDIAWKTARLAGLPRFAALGVLGGYLWLAAAGVMALAYGGVPAGPYYEALLHSLFLGHVFSLVFGHAPIILPAILGLPAAFHPVSYAHLALLHASLLLRVGADLALAGPARAWGGLLNAAALLLFLGSTAFTVLKARREGRGQPPLAGQAAGWALPGATGEGPGGGEEAGIRPA